MRQRFASGIHADMARRVRVNQHIKDKLDEVFGKDGGVAVDELLEIAFGRRTVKTPVLVPGLTGGYAVLDVPASPKERADILMNLLAFQQGRPRQQVEVEHTVKRPLLDATKLSSEDLNALKEIEQKALTSGDAEDGDVVDAEFSENEEDKEPKK